MQVGTNAYFNLQNYSNNFKTQDSQPTFGEVESQNTPFSEAIAQQESEQNTDITAPESPSGEKLDESEQQYVRELAAIDANVRAHEAAHIGAGAGVVSGGASFGYTRGPDGKMYATSGEVPITMKEGRTPEETISNARQIISAAMAPADPSPQDYKVAANAAQMESRARSEQAQERAEEIKEQLNDSKESQDSIESSNALANPTNATNTSDSKRQVDFTAQNSNGESKNLFNNMQQKKPSYGTNEEGLVAYAIRSYTANATNDSYIPRLEIAG